MRLASVQWFTVSTSANDRIRLYIDGLPFGMLSAAIPACFLLGA